MLTTKTHCSPNGALVVRIVNGQPNDICFGSFYLSVSEMDGLNGLSSGWRIGAQEWHMTVAVVGW